jgi:GNAT superfamily N-acetyltransferase
MLQSPDLDLISAIERHTARAWPAPIVIACHGWEMRFAPNSSSKRVNSLNPVQPEAGQFRTVLKTYLNECAQRNVKGHVRLLPLAREGEAKFLQAHGLTNDGGTSVDVIEAFPSSRSDQNVILSGAVTDAWLDAYTGAHDYGLDERAAIKAILETVPYKMGFAHITENGVPIAAGRTAIIEGMAGFNQIATAPDQRRKGHARRIMTALMAFAAEQGARRGYLQVEITNMPARALYASLGFKSLYIYDYWALPTSINL